MIRTGAILAGGFGTRLSAAVPDRAKSVAPVNGRPFLIFPLMQLARSGVERVILCTGHRTEQVREEIGDNFDGLPLLYSIEDQPLGTGGAIRQAWRTYGGGEQSWVTMNGDSFLDIDLAELAAEHAQGGFAATIAAVKVPAGQRFGTLEWDPSGRVVAFREKDGAGGPKWINGGIYVLSARFLDSLPEGAPMSIETQGFPAGLAQGIGVFPREARFIDIGTPESYALAQEFFQGEL
jgi:D-glycero-alpha-D-manno-heptose 1-phosphate guanylyltransferase